MAKKKQVVTPEETAEKTTLENETTTEQKEETTVVETEEKTVEAEPETPTQPKHKFGVVKVYSGHSHRIRTKLVRKS